MKLPGMNASGVTPTVIVVPAGCSLPGTISSQWLETSSPEPPIMTLPSAVRFLPM